jgi:hypothetical protein
MAQCEVCGNEYDETFEVVKDGDSHVFDCFECAIQAFAPTCSNCGIKIIGHGREAGGLIFCCGHCARRAGHSEVTDSV